MKFWLVLVSAVIALTTHGAIYKWIDSSGDVHFSDKPRPGSEEIELPEVQTYSAPSIPETPQPITDTLVDEAKNYYKSITIVQPKDQETIRNAQGYVAVIVEISPGLREGDKLQLIYDGTTIGTPQTSLVFGVKDVYRGSHILSVQILDAKGEVLKTSSNITIFMHNPRVGMGRGR